ncbi:MAG TPA: hypothetical protein VK821_18965 [Dehalococcoidia bacterium]|nr:hypothetical protein [Dehalococcoidia bacterium]
MPSSSKLVYVVAVDMEPDWEDEANRWYNDEHIPALLSVPGYIGARRYVAVEGEPKYLNWYEIDSMDTFRSEARHKAVDTPWTARVRPHTKTRLTIYEQIFPDAGPLKGAAWSGDTSCEGGLLVNRQDADPAMEEDFNNWYHQEHLPALSQVPGCIAVHRFRAVEGAPKYMAVYHLTEPAVQASDAWKKAIDTPWSARVRPAFQNRWRTVYKPLQS